MFKITRSTLKPDITWGHEPYRKDAQQNLSNTRLPVAVHIPENEPNVLFRAKFKTYATNFAFSSDDRKLLVSTNDGYVHRANLFKTDRQISFSSESTYNPSLLPFIAVGKNKITLANHPSGKTALSPDCSIIVSGLYEEEVIAYKSGLIEKSCLSEITRFREEAGIWSTAISPNNKLIVLGLRNKIDIYNLIDIESGSPKYLASFRGYYYNLSPFHGYSLNMSVTKFSPDGKTLVCGGPKGHLWFFDINDMKTSISGNLKPFAGVKFNKAVDDVCFDPSGERLAVSVSGGRLYTLNSTKRKPTIITEYSFPKNYIHTLKFSPDGKELLLSGAVRDEKKSCWHGLFRIINPSADSAANSTREEYMDTSGDLLADYNRAGDSIVICSFNGDFEFRIRDSNGLFFANSA